MAEPVSALRDLDELSGYTEQNPLSVGEEQQKAIQELERRGINPPEKPEFGYDYGGDRGLTDMFMPFRREVISPEQTIPTGNISFGPRGNMQQEVKTIPAQYGESEFGMEYMPLVRGTKSALNAVGDLLFGDAGEQAAVAKSALNMAEGLGQYATEQVKAAASGGQYYDPEQQRIVSFDPTSVMFGGNPATGQAVLGSGVRLSSGGGKTGNRIAGASALRDIGIADEFPTTFTQSTIDAYTEQNLDPRIFKTGAGAQPRSKEIQRNLDTNIEYGDQRLKEIPSLNLEDYEGYGFMSPIADTSGAGDVIKTINGVPVDVSRRGGQDFMFDPESGELLWASDYKVIRGMQENPAPSTFMGTAQELYKRTGKSPLLIPHSMTPTGVDFSQVAETMLGYAKNNMDKSTLKSLNKDIKEIYPDWLGLENKDSISNLNRTSGEYRKKIINLLDQKYRNKGGLTAGQARLAMIDEDQRIIRAGTLRNVGAMDGFRNPLTGNPHPVYNAGMYGEGLGRINLPISVYELNPQAAQLGGLRLDQILRPPRATGKQGGLRSLEGSPLTGVITEDVLRGIEQRRN